MDNADQLGKQTIQDFGEQWQRVRENEGYYASPELFADLVEPLATAAEFDGARVADIGSGTGRIVNMLAGAGAQSIIAVEPSAAAEVLAENTRHLSNVEIVNVPGDQLPQDRALDWVVSFGVLHHIPQPEPVAKAMFGALHPGGKALVWLYGHEGNEMYLRFAEPLRKVTMRMPDTLLVALCWLLMVPLTLYAWLSKVLPIPMADYMQGHILKLSPKVRMLTIYDQLNPAYAKYYREAEAKALLADAGFEQVQTYHRHGYSWTVVGVRP